MNNGIFKWLRIQNAEPGDGPEKSPGLKTTSLNLKISDSEGNLGAGMTNPASVLDNIHLVQSYSVHAASSFYRRRQEKTPRKKTVYKRLCWHLFTQIPRQFKTRVTYATPCSRTPIFTYSAEGIPKLCTGNPLHRTDAALPGKLDFPFCSSTIDPTIHPNGINPGVHDNCWTGQLVALSVLLPRFCATPLFLALSLRVHDLVSLLFRLLGQSELEGGEAGNRRLCPSTLDAAVLAVSEKPKATLVWPGAVCVRLPSVPHCVWVRTSKHDVIALAAFRNSWALRPSLRPTHSRALPDVRFCLINFLSGSTPPKSAKRSRLTQGPPPKKFGNAAKKKIRGEGELFWGGTFF